MKNTETPLAPGANWPDRFGVTLSLPFPRSAAPTEETRRLPESRGRARRGPDRYPDLRRPEVPAGANPEPEPDRLGFDYQAESGVPTKAPVRPILRLSNLL